METDRDRIRFLFKSNLHRLMGFSIDDNDINRIAAIFNCSPDMLAEITKEFKRNVSRIAKEIFEEMPGRIQTLEKNGRKVICIGDSISSDRESYQYILREVFHQSQRVQFIDSAVAGNTTKDLRERFYNTVLNHDFDTAILFIGTNDAKMLHDQSFLPLTSLSDYLHSMKCLIRYIQKQNAQVFVVTLPYVDVDRLRTYFPDQNFFFTKNHIDCMNALIGRIVSEMNIGVIDIAAELKSAGDMLEPDGIHINNEAHKLLAKMIIYEISE